MTGEARPEQDEKRRQVAILVALRTGLLRKCATHGDLYDPGQHDFQGACMTATYLVNRDDPLVAPFDGDRGALTDLLKAICRSYGAKCPQCAAAAPAPAPG